MKRILNVLSRVLHTNSFAPVVINQLPDTMKCELDGRKMKFVSEELGYSCTGPQCPLHIEAA
jgi:hypothetical protein